MPVGMVGRESLQFTFAAGSGPLFVTVIVYGRFASGATVAGAVLVAATSAGSPAAATAGGGEAVGAFAGGAWARWAASRSRSRCAWGPGSATERRPPAAASAPGRRWWPWARSWAGRSLRRSLALYDQVVPRARVVAVVSAG